ncbi:hypothetical protein BCR43DRAFT_378421 [Syncephalastrum racemosum]|uniref:Uncharacterized protein n=1 Tax=Syncephalastrum racemosum TaxID=13706 RepID=A0A1X2H513_SYNRA|nr:hypothetical protein BCR43DRAFT_378421 [Syncephalastrum racemosum]
MSDLDLSSYLSALTTIYSPYVWHQIPHVHCNLFTTNDQIKSTASMISSVWPGHRISKRNKQSNNSVRTVQGVSPPPCLVKPGPGCEGRNPQSRPISNFSSRPLQAQA